MKPKIDRQLLAWGAALCVFALAMPHGSSQDLPSGAIPVAAAPELEGLPERWIDAAKGLGVPGFAVAVVKDRVPYAFDRFGYGANDAAHPIDPHTMFYIASITKTYTALGVAILADEGLLDLDAPVRDYLERFELADEEAAQRITVRDLLCHRPGINQGNIVWLDAYTGQITEDRFYHWLSTVEPRGEVTYTNVHFTIAGRVIEAVTGKKWQDYLQEALFDEIGMTRTTAYASRMYSDPNCAFPMVQGEHGFVESEVRKTDRVMHAAGGMGTTAVDGARWIELFLNGGQIDGVPVVSADAIEDALTYQCQFPEPDGEFPELLGFGYGWQLGSYRGRRYANHGGGYVGTAAHISMLPDDGLGVVVLCNSSPGGHALTNLVFTDVYDRLLGESGHRDRLPSALRANHERRMSQLAERRELLALVPPRAEDLGVPLGHCAGTFHHPFLGALTFWEEGECLRGRYGDVMLWLTSVAEGRPGCRAVSAAGNEFDILFAVEDGKPAPQMTLDGDTVFLRQSSDP